MLAVRKRLSKFKDLRCAVRNPRSFNIGGGGFDIDFALRGPDLQALASYAEQLREKSKELGGIVDADTTLKLDRPELRVEIDRERAAALGVDMSDVGSALQLMVGGDQQVSRFHDPGINDDYDVQLRLAEGSRNDPEAIKGLFVPGRDGKLYQLGNFVSLHEETTASRVDRLDRQRQVSLRASVAPGYALADRLEALAAGVRRDEPAAHLLDGGRRQRPRAGAHLQRVHLGAHAVDHLHVHDPRLAVRERGPPADHPAVTAAGRALRPALAVGDAQHAQPLLGAGHPGALRRGEEERHPADRPHEQPAGAGDGPPAGDPPGQPRPAAADPDDHAGPGGRHAPARPRHRPGRRGAAGDRRRGHRRPEPLAAC